MNSMKVFKTRLHKTHELRLRSVHLECWTRTGHEDSADKFSTALNSRLVSAPLLECHHYLEAGLINPAAKKLSEIYTTAADATLDTKEKKTENRRHPYKHKQKPKKWYDNECRTMKNTSRKLGILKQKDPNNKE